MFNKQLKADLQRSNEQFIQLQQQYDLVHGLLLQRQDDVVALQRELAEKPELSHRVFIDKLKVSAREKLPYLSNRVLIELGDELMKVVCDEFGIDRLMVHDHSDPNLNLDEDED